MTIEKIGITYSAIQEEENYLIKGEIQKYRDNTFVAKITLQEGEKTIIECKFYSNYEINYKCQNLQKIEQYQQILLQFFIDAIDEIKTLNEKV